MSINFYDNIKIKRLCLDHKFTSFNCGDDDLNDFLFSDSIPHLKELYAVTYLVLKGDDTIAYYSVSNDSIVWNRIGKDLKENICQYLPSEKAEYGSAPAVKIGRFGVDKNYAGKGLGSFLLDGIKTNFTYDNKTGCRFVTVDALNNAQAISFYTKNGFKPLLEKSKMEKRESIPMYFDLFQYNKASELTRINYSSFQNN